MGGRFDDTSIKSFFVIEAQEYIVTVRRVLSKLTAAPFNFQAIEEIQKTAHTLKGSAAMLGFDDISKLSRYMEEFMKALMNGSITYNEDIKIILMHLVEIIEVMLTNISENKEELNEQIFKSNVFIFEKTLEPYRAKQIEESLKPEKLSQKKDLGAADTQAPKSNETGPQANGRLIAEEKTLMESIPGTPVNQIQETAKETINSLEAKNIEVKSVSQIPEPKETDFYVTTSQTTSLQPEKREKHGMSFLDMIPDIKESFILEATDHIQTIDHLLLDWESDYKNQDLTLQIMRAAHSLKGSANMVGFTELGSISHRTEEIIEKIQEGEIEVNIPLIDLLFEGLDTMKLLLKGLDEGEAEDAELAMKTISKLDSFISGVPLTDTGKVQTQIPSKQPSIGSEAAEGTASTVLPEPTTSITGETESILKAASESEKSLVPETEIKKIPTTGPFPALGEDELSKSTGTLATRIPLGETEKQIVRVHINQLDNLMNLVGELVINRSKIDRRVEFFKHIGDELDFSRKRLTDSVREFSDKYEFTLPAAAGEALDQTLDEFSALEFDKYDDFNILSRSLMEIGTDVVEIINEMKEFLSKFDKEIEDIAAIISRLQEEISRARMVPVGRLFRRFVRTVRDIAKREGKNVQLLILGEDTDLDKTVIEEMADPLMHLVRNAVSHGIEPSNERALLGKNRQGTVLLNAYPKGNTIIIEVEDDGKGLDLELIKKIAIEMGLLTEEAAETVSQAVLIDFIFSPGFTTSSATTEISGRGIGLDVVRQNILHLGGSISVQTEKNIGTRFIIRLPLTLAITRALLVSVSGYNFALPLNAVEETIVVDSKKIMNLATQDVIEIRERKIPFLKLNELLQLPDGKNNKRFIPVVILGSAESSAALMVDELLGQEEIVVKRFGAYLESLRYFSGATISGDGKVVLILDPAHLIGFEEFAISATGTMESTLRERIGIEEKPAEAEEEKRGKLLLVDDSISIRKFVGKLLENAGYDVDVAIDGLEALTKVEAARYNIIITDLEMPRMHGYEFISELKNNDRFKSIPIIVLTSRAGEKHKRKAMEKGADGYIVKPFNEETLLENIAKFL